MADNTYVQLSIWDFLESAKEVVYNTAIGWPKSLVPILPRALSALGITGKVEKGILLMPAGYSKEDLNALKAKCLSIAA